MRTASGASTRFAVGRFVHDPLLKSQFQRDGRRAEPGMIGGMNACLKICGLVSALGLFGCGTHKTTDAGQSAHAKYVLVSALDAWKSGTQKSLSTRTPPIRFVDDDLSAGFSLVDYYFEDESATITPFQNVQISLFLKDSQGRTAERLATYQVGVEPTLTVLRSDN